MTARKRSSHILPSVLALTLSALWPLAALAVDQTKVQVLLVGVSAYPNLDEQLQLSGPANDIASYYQMLRDRGVPADNIHVVADATKLKGASLPTKAAILNGFNQIEQSLRASPSPDNFVFVLMSGHGSQMPAAAGDTSEADGLDEIFLARDVGKWDGEIGALPNAISDNEIAAAIERLRATGAFVWAVFDNCHSGSITRGSSMPGEISRSVSPAALGIPAQAMTAAANRSNSQRSRGGPTQESMIDGAASSTTKGGVVAFYASQSYEVTPEYLLPQYSSDASQRGLFSYTLQQVLNVAPAGATYRQVAEDVLQRYRGLGRSSPTPSIEGSALDAPVFGSSVAAAPRQWPLKTSGADMLLSAGQLQEVTRGSILALLPEASAEDSKVMGYVEVIEAGATQSRVQAIAYQGKPAISKSRIGSAGVYARPVELKIDFSLRVAEPQRSSSCDAPNKSLLSLVQELKTASTIARRVQWVEAGQNADIRLCFKKDRVLLLDASADSNDPLAPSISLDAGAQPVQQGKLSDAAIELGSALERIGRATNLVRLVSNGTASKPLLEFNLNYERHCTADKADCAPGFQPVNPLSVTSLRDGDKVYVSVKNTSFEPVDFSALYVDAAYGISLLYPGEAESARVEPAATATFEVDINADPIGHEKLMFVAVPAEPQSPETRFDSLAQSGLVLSQTRGANTGSLNPLLGLLEEAAFGGASGSIRGGARPTQLLSPQVSFFEWSVTK